LFDRAVLVVAIDAVDRTSGARLEGYLGFLSTFAAFNSEELAGSGRRESLNPFLSRFLGSFRGPGNPASGTALGRMVVTLGLEGLLFFYGENIRGFAIEAD
jgi:hypothetical protein